MDRSAANGLLAIGVLWMLASGVGWALPSPLEDWPRIVVEPGAEPIPQPPSSRSGGTITDEEASAMYQYGLIEALRYAPLCGGGLCLLAGAVMWGIGRERAAAFLGRVFIIAGLATAVAFFSAALFTPPDPVSMALLALPMLLFGLPVGAAIAYRRASG